MQQSAAWPQPDPGLGHVEAIGRRSSSWVSKVTLSWWTTCRRPEESMTSADWDALRAVIMLFVCQSDDVQEQSAARGYK